MPTEQHLQEAPSSNGNSAEEGKKIDPEIAARRARYWQRYLDSFRSDRDWERGKTHLTPGQTAAEKKYLLALAKEKAEKEGGCREAQG